MSAQTESNMASASSPLLPRSNDEQEQKKDEVQTTPVLIAAVVQGSPTKSLGERPVSTVSQSGEQQVSNEYRFIHQRIPPKEGKLRFLLPALLIGLQIVFIVLFGVFANYSSKPEQSASKYPMFEDLHAIALLGFGFIMTFLKRYGYGSVGFNLLLVAFVIQWALLIRGFLGSKGSFELNLDSLIYADYTAIAVLITLGAVLGKTTLAQLVVVALIEVVAQVFNEFLNTQIIKTYDVGRSVYVHLFGALFGLAVSKLLHLKGVKSSKQAPVYHSDLFSLVGTLFLWVYYPSFNGLLAKASETEGQVRAIVNTLAAISASCVVTFGVSSLAGKGKLNVLHVQHATIAGGIAIGSVADLRIQVYVALIVGSVAGLLSTIGYQYIDPFVTRVLKLHDTCSVQSLHALPGLIAAILGAIFAACSSFKEYDHALYIFYPARIPTFNSTEYLEQNIQVIDGQGRSALEQAGFQLAGLAITIGIALVSGALTGLILRLPIFEQLSEDVEMFDDEAQWVTPDDYALKLTFASNPTQQSTNKTENETGHVTNEEDKV